MNERIIGSIGASSAQISDYGEVVAVQGKRKPDSQGEGWQCWYPLGILQMGDSPQIGLVRASLDTPVIRMVESHPTRSEWVYAIDRPIIQVVALTGKNPEKLADVETAKAILLQPGEGILIRAGVWHAPAFAADLREALYGFVLAASDPKVQEAGLVPFFGNHSVRVSNIQS